MKLQQQNCIGNFTLTFIELGHHKTWSVSNLMKNKLKVSLKLLLTRRGKRKTNGESCSSPIDEIRLYSINLFAHKY